MVDSKKKRGLGRGLSALMSDVNDLPSVNDDNPTQGDLLVPIEHIHPNPDQPRRIFQEEALNDLADSIKMRGIIQPLIVRKDIANAGEYEIVAGERRWRASQKAGLHELPVIIREFTDTEVLEVAIIENIQREDLNPIEEAMGYSQLMERFGHTQEKVASGLGKSRSHIANSVRLLSLPDDVKDHLSQGSLTAGHARTLIGRENASQLAALIVKKSLSVREAEKLAKRGVIPQQRPRPVKSHKDADTLQVESDLSAQLSMKVEIHHSKTQSDGKVTIHYKNLEQLDDLMQLLTGGIG